MATETIKLGINVRMDNRSESKTKGLYYPVVETRDTLSLRGFAKHLVGHGSIYDRSIIEGVLTKICECLPELVSQGIPVKLDPLGTFYPTAEGKPIEFEGLEGANPAEYVKGIHIRFRPNSTKLDNITSKAFKNTCSLEFRNIISSEKVTVNGKEKVVQRLTPIATAITDSKKQNGEQEPEQQEP